jgi:cell division control protein 6
MQAQLFFMTYLSIKLAFNDDVISGAAINLCAAMAGKENGDARKAIDLLRGAAEIAERERSANVEEKHIRLAQEKIEKDTNYEVLKNSTTHTKIVILAILKSKNGNTGEVYEIYSDSISDKHISFQAMC